MMGYAGVAITDTEVYEGPAGVIGTLTGTLTVHTTGEQYPLTMVHQADNGTVRKIDVYTKNPDELAAFYARAEAGTH
ncbi:hypothetical protein [Nocardia salmonicida]|nr:hypothetical protein [Nocardia salmonicida]